MTAWPSAARLCVAGLLGLRLSSALRVSALPRCPDQAVNVRGKVIPEEDWQKAAREEGLDPASISLFGRLAPKIPRSTIEGWKNEFIAKTRMSKTIRYSFMGKLNNNPKMVYDGRIADVRRKRRYWVEDLADANFTGEDYLSVVDVHSDYKSLGCFDHTSPEKHLKKPAVQNHREVGFEAEAEHREEFYYSWFDRPEYLRITGKSRFVMCPGGDGPWSRRMFELPFMRAIPVIKSEEEDWLPEASTKWNKQVLGAIAKRLRYITIDCTPGSSTACLPKTSYNETLAEENWRTAIKYMTFMEGDNEIPGMKPCIIGDNETSLMPS